MPDDKLPDLFVAYHTARFTFLRAAKDMRVAVTEIEACRLAFKKSRQTLLDLAQQLGPKLHADVSGVTGFSKLDETALDACIQQAKLDLGVVTDATQQIADAAQ